MLVYSWHQLHSNVLLWPVKLRCLPLPCVSHYGASRGWLCMGLLCVPVLVPALSLAAGTLNSAAQHLWTCHSDRCGVMFPENFRPCWLWELQADLDAALGVALDFILKWESIFCHSLHCLAPMGSMNIQCLGARETQKSTSRLEAISQAKRNILCIQRSWIELDLTVRETNTWN